MSCLLLTERLGNAAHYSCVIRSYLSLAPSFVFSRNSSYLPLVFLPASCTASPTFPPWAPNPTPWTYRSVATGAVIPVPCTPRPDPADQPILPRREAPFDITGTGGSSSSFCVFFSLDLLDDPKAC